MLVVRETDGFNYFEVLTLCPYDRNLLKMELLSEEDIRHINYYHHEVRTTLLSHLSTDK